MDLRGLTPDDVYALMKGGLEKSQIDAIDQYRKDSMAQNQLQHQDLVKSKEMDDQLAREKFQADQSEVKVGTPVNVNGKMVQVYHDKMGNVVRREVLGDAPEKFQNKKLLKDADGNPYWNGPEDGPPKPGSTELSSKENGFSINDQYTLSFLKSGIESGLDKDGNEIDEVTRDNNMTLVNMNDNANQYVKIPGKEVPGMFNSNIPPKYIKLPRGANQILALPEDKIIFHDEKAGKALTVGAVKQFAKEKGYTPEQVLKYLGLSK
jgi:hypothetical protein